jgi:hypothetical protein
LRRRRRRNHARRARRGWQRAHNRLVFWQAHAQFTPKPRRGRIGQVACSVIGLKAQPAPFLALALEFGTLERIDAAVPDALGSAAPAPSASSAGAAAIRSVSTLRLGEGRRGEAGKQGRNAG